LILRPTLPTPEAIKVNLLRGVMAAFSATTFFYALQMLPLAEAIAFSFLSPLFLAFFGFVLLGEAVSRNTMLGLIFGFCGMLVMALGQGAGGNAMPLSGVLAAIGSALSYAFSLILLRKRAQQDAVVTIVLFQNIVPGIILALPAASVWVRPHPSDALLFFAIGLLGVGGHLCMAHAFRRAEATALAPTEYSALLFATLFGYLVFGDIPALATIFGASLIIIGTLLAVRRKS
jgi:drug/metabolite transporter (DMT)-like permease